ncbi:MAG: imidazolonepropionase [Sphingobacteriales bacterium 12-47-4]|nr:MAG: imidazolonepropionase [Sphingobacteriales bacterium 12-47-4]
MSLLFTHIHQLVNVRKGTEPLRGKEMAELPLLEDAYLLVEDGIITGYGKMADMPASLPNHPNKVDATGRLVLPAWCDSHTHLVFPGSREHEFVDKLKGLSYAEIAARGGGILNSARQMDNISEDQLFNSSWKRLNEVAALGTGAIEIKSGYGLTIANELKILRVIKKLKERSGLLIRSTFLGAHAFPAHYKENRDGYIREIMEKMIPLVAGEKLADYIDVFCETGFFTPEETEKIALAGIAAGLKPRLHVNQLNSIGGIEAGIRVGALSLDHLETVTDKDVALLAGQPEDRSGKCFTGISTLLPTAAFFLRMPFQPARKIIDAGAAVAIASDFNPGSSPSGNMNLVVAMSCIGMRMLPEEAINAASINAAVAMEFETVAGSIAIGKKANLILTKPVKHYNMLPYLFGDNLINQVFLNGQPLHA